MPVRATVRRPHKSRRLSRIFQDEDAGSGGLARFDPVRLAERDGILRFSATKTSLLRVLCSAGLDNLVGIASCFPISLRELEACPCVGCAKPAAL